jgi:hypothetical protein
LFCQKNLAGRSFVACPNFHHCLLFSPSLGKIHGQADVSHEASVLKKTISRQKIKQNLKNRATIWKIKMPIHPSSFYNQSFTPSLLFLY